MSISTDYAPVINTYNKTPDETLVLACRRGEADAWSALVHRYQRLVYTIPRRAGLDEDQTAEVFQRTFTRLLENLDRIRRPESIHAWLATTARRETLQLIREQNAERSFPLSGEIDERLSSGIIADRKPLPDETMEHLAEQEIIRTALSGMDERCRCLLALLYYSPDPPSYAEIAMTLDMPEGSLGPTRARCLEKLRHLFERANI